MTKKLSHAWAIVRHAMSKRIELEVEMNDVSCPWCEAELVLRLVGDDQTCAECGTSWSYEDESEIELPLAA